MTLKKAIELNRQAVESLQKGKFPDHAKAVELGIEALKRIQFLQDPRHKPKEPPLPGETEEGE